MDKKTLKRIIITGFPHSGTTILRAIIGHIPSVYEARKECIKPTREDINAAIQEGKKYILTKWPWAREFLSSKYKDHIKIFVMRNPLLVFSSWKRRFGRFPDEEAIEEYLYAVKEFVKRPHLDNLYLIKYEDLFANRFAKLRGILDSIGLEYTDDIFDNSQHQNYSHIHIKSLPPQKPSDKDHERFRTYQINQPFKNMNDPEKINLNDEEQDRIMRFQHVAEMYPDIIRDIKVVFGKELKYHHFYDYVLYGLKLVASKHNVKISMEYDEEMKGAIYVDGELTGLIVYCDWPGYDAHSLRIMAEHDPQIIFKYQYDNAIMHPTAAVAGGFFSKVLWKMCIKNDPLLRPNEMNRDIDINARMLDWSSPRNNKYSWVGKRRRVIQVAERIAKEGEYKVALGKLSTKMYFAELPRCKIGFNWQGWAMLNFRLYEFMYYGLAILTQPLNNHPLREGIKLIDGETAIFCDEKDFYKEAKLLLRDEKKIEKIGANGRELFFAYLSPNKTGEWYYNKLREAKCQMSSM